MKLYSKNKKLDLLEMVEDAFTRGQDRIFENYRHANGTVEKVSYNQIKIAGENICARLEALGLKQGERIAIVTAMRPYWYSLLYACLKGKFIMVGIDPNIAPISIKKMMAETGCKVAFTSLDNLVCDMPTFSMEEGFPAIGEVRAIKSEKYEEMPEGTFFVLYSSGTTSENRKGVLLSKESITTGIEHGMYNKAYRIRKRDLMLFPPYHIAALLLIVFDLYNNTEMYYMEKLTPNSIATALAEFKPDNISTVPAVITPMMKKMKAKLSKVAKMVVAFCGFVRRTFGINLGKKLHLAKFLKGFMIGGSPCDEETMRFFLNIGVEVSLAYGLTELGAPLCATGMGYYPIGTGPVMKKNGKMDIRIAEKDEDGRGEVEIKSPYQMISYLDPKQNEGCFTEDGYYKTGDLGYFKGKNLIICGRKKEAIVLKNGEKLLPEEIEKQYLNISHVTDVAAFRVKESSGCDAFSLAVIKNKDENFPDESIKLRVIDRSAKLLPMFRPKDVFVIKEFPYSSSHKVQRFRLAEMAEKGLINPETESMQIIIDEDEQVGKIRQMLVKVSGETWKTCELTKGTQLNLSSLEMMELCVEIQQEYGIDFFELSTMPETFGEMLDAINNFEYQDKSTKEKIDYSKYPLKVNALNRTLGKMTGYLGKNILYHVKSTDTEKVPKDHNFILCSNHNTNLDPLWILTSLDAKTRSKTAVVGKAEILNNKFLTKIVSTQNYIPVERGGNIGKTLERCKELLKQDWNILIFPEGTAFENGTEMLPFKPGAATLCLETGVPILSARVKGYIPVNTDEAKFLPKHSDKLEVKFGQLIYPENDTIETLNSKLRDAINKL